MKKKKIITTKNKLQSETGAGLLEYALLVAMIALVAYAGSTPLIIEFHRSLVQSNIQIVGAVGGTGPCDSGLTLMCQER